MKFTLIVSNPPDSLLSLTALNFVKATAKSEHQIYRLFFHNQGIRNLIKAEKVQQERISEWQTLINYHKIDTVACVSSAQKFNIQTSDQLIDGAELAGLGQLIEAESASERVLSF